MAEEQHDSARAKRGAHARQPQESAAKPSPSAKRGANSAYAKQKQPQRTQSQRTQQQPQQQRQPQRQSQKPQPQPQQPQQPQKPQQQQRQKQPQPQLQKQLQQKNSAHLEQQPPVAGAYRPVAVGSHKRQKGGFSHGAQTQRAQGAYASNEKAGKKRKSIWRVVFIISAIVFVISLGALGTIWFSYWQGQNTYDTVVRESFDVPEDIAGTALSDLKVDWDALRAVNPDTVGWVYIPDTAINYPIVHTNNNEKYLKTDFRGETNWIVSFGAIFLETRNAADFSDDNNVIYGHNMNDGSMFSAIVDLEGDAFNEHRNVYLLTPQGNYRLNTFALLHTTADDPLVQTGFAFPEELTSYVQDKLDRSIVSPNPAAPAAADITKVFTFSTCDNLPTDGRYVLFCSVAEYVSFNEDAAASGTPNVVDSTSAEAIESAVEQTV